MPVINNTDIQDLFVGGNIGAAILRSGQFVYNRFGYQKFTWTGTYKAFQIPYWVDGLVIFAQAGGGGGDCGDGGNGSAGLGGNAGNARIIEYTDIKRNWPSATHLYYSVGGGGNGGTNRGSGRAKAGGEAYVSLASYFKATLPTETSEYRPISSSINTVAGGSPYSSGSDRGQNAPSVTLKPREKRMTKSATGTKTTGGQGGIRDSSGTPGTWGAGGGGGNGGIFGQYKNGGDGGNGSIEVWMWGYYPPYQNSKVEYSVAGGYKVPVPSWATSYAYAIFGGGAGGMNGSTTQGGTGGDSGATSLGYGSMTAGSVATFDVTIGAGGAGGVSGVPSSGGASRIITNVATQSAAGGAVNLSNVPEPTNGFGNGYNSIDAKFAKFIKSTAGAPYRPCVGGAAGTVDSVDGKNGTKGGGGGGGYIKGNGGKGADGYIAIWFWEQDPSA